MNFFEFYKLVPSFQINLTELRKRYYEKSREMHPDSMQAGNDLNMDAEYLSALNNQAYKTLLHPLSRLKYLLDTEFAVDGLEASSDDPEFLIEMMDLHESIQDALIENDDALLTEGKMQLSQLEDCAQKDVEPFLVLFEQGLRTGEIKSALQFYYNKLKYFTRLKETMGGKETEL